MSHFEKIKNDALEQGITHIAGRKGSHEGYAEDLVFNYCTSCFGDRFKPPHDAKWIYEILLENPELLTRGADDVLGTYASVYTVIRALIVDQVIAEITPRLTEIAVDAGFPLDDTEVPVKPR